MKKITSLILTQTPAILSMKSKEVLATDYVGSPYSYSKETSIRKTLELTTKKLVKQPKSFNTLKALARNFINKTNTTKTLKNGEELSLMT